MLVLHLKRIGLFTLIGFLLALAWILFSPPVYEAQVNLQVGSGRPVPDPTLPASIQSMVDKATMLQTATEVEVLRQKQLFIKALQDVQDKHPGSNLVDNWEQYYKMYTVLGGPTTAEQNAESMSSFVGLQVRAYSPDIAMEIANAISDEYRISRKSNQRLANTQAEQYLKDQSTMLEAQLKQLDHEYMLAKKATSMADLKLSSQNRLETQQLVLNKRDSIATEYAGALNSAAHLKRELARLPKTVPGPSNDIRNPVIDTLQQQLTTAETNLQAISITYKPTAPEYKRAEAAVENLRTDLANARKTHTVAGSVSQQPNPLYESIHTQSIAADVSAKSLGAQLVTLNEQLARQDQLVGAIPADEEKISSIERDRETADTKYRYVKQAYDEMEQRLNGGQDPAIILSLPSRQLVDKPVEPNPTRSIIIGLLAGISLGAIFSVARESIRPLVFSATQLEQATGLPVVATLPKLPGGEVQRIRTLLNSSRFPRKNFHDMASVALADRESLPRTVVICGVDNDAGSSMAAVSYAAALAKTGLRVTLVDANPSKVLSRVFEMENEDGIVDYLTQAALISQNALARFSMLTKQIDQIGVKFCPFGVADVTTLTEFSDDRIAGIIEALKPDMDVLVIETAPSGRQPDAVRMGRHADEVLATFESGTSNDRTVDTLRDLFAEAGVKKMAMVLTNTAERVA